jgi:uncharacterized Zn finger protein
MIEVALLTKPRILRQVGEASVHKAKPYLNRDAWSDLRVQADTIKGRCQGQAPDPYRVTVTIVGTDIEDAECSCPAGAGGHCKHVAALLLFYREHPDMFVEVEELDAALERRSKGELVALIRRMIRRSPDLESLLESPLPGYLDGTAADDPTPYRRQVRAAFEHAGDNGHAAPAVAHELNDIVATGDEFREAGAHAAAVTVYRAVAEEVLERFGRLSDDEGDLLDVVGDCASGLCECLKALPADAANRDTLVKALVDVYVTDEAHGGLGVSDSVPDALLHQTTPDERRQIAARLREALPKGNAWSDEYQRRAIGAFLLELGADDRDDEAYLRQCRETGRAVELADRLANLEMAEAAEKEFPREAISLYRNAAEALIEQRTRDSYRSACEHLRKVRALSRRLNENGAWDDYFAGLMDRCRSLRALREELESAKLT